MKIFFAASLNAQKINKYNYLAIIDILESLGHKVLSEHITEIKIEKLDQSFDWNLNYHRKIIHNIKSADLIVAEISSQSVSVGYLLSQAMLFEKPVLALTSSKVLPNITMFLENSGQFVLHSYTKIVSLEKEIPLLLKQFDLEKRKKFNFFLPIKLNKYLNQSAKKQKISKSEYLRKLLEKDQKHPL